jgi:phosphoribosylamine--glycine ligase
MRVLVVGAGGREHALAWKIARSPRVERVLAAPGSDGMAREAECFADVKAGDAAALATLARRERVDLVVIGPEEPLASGVADRLREAGLAVFGPSQAAARLEGSKAFARAFMARHGIPHPRFEVCAAREAALAAVRARGGRCVVKADGLAAGKGVAVCASVADAEAALDEMMGQRRFGAAGERVVVEDVLVGEEASYYAISDGVNVATLAAAQDHKRALDGDRGENTGGMGAYAPAPLVTPPVEKRILEEIVHPTLAGLRSEGMPYQGVLYVGLMIDPAGAPSVVEFNVRFGDPETQALVLAMDGDLVPLLDGAARGTLTPGAAGVSGAAVCVVLASGGYPRAIETGKPIRGIEAAEADPDVVVFHAGTKRADGAFVSAGGAFVTAGGRVLGVTACGADVAAARARAYAAADRIHFDGMQLRRDIAARALRA